MPESVLTSLQPPAREVRAYAAQTSTSPVAPYRIGRRAPNAEDVVLDVLYCGVCHTDLHQTRNEWGGAVYPMVPGHEIVGRVVETGSNVTKFKVGDVAAVGCMVDSCRHCQPCLRGLEQYCENGFTQTYNSPDKQFGGITYGGYAETIVVAEVYTLKVPDGMDLAATAPLLCAGITTYSPLRHWKVGPGKRVGIIGLGGLGHMAVKIAHALGAHVTLFTTSPRKRADGLRLGADEVVVSSDEGTMRKRAGSLDFVLDAVSAEHDINKYLDLVTLDGALVLVGVPDKPLPVAAFNLILARRHFVGSNIGGIAETQEMLNFCQSHGLACDIEVIAIQQINEAYERLKKNDVKYRFVIDMATLKK